MTPGIDFSTGYFPVTLVPDPEVAWVAVSSMTRQQSAEGDGTIEIVVEGSVRMVGDGLVDYRFSLTDGTGALHEDSGGVLLGHHEEGEEIPYQTTIGVPKGATFFSSFNIRFEGEEEPKLRLHMELPLSRIPLRAP